MKILKKLMIVAGLGLTLTACTNKEKEAEFKYCIDQFADIQVLRYRIPGWDGLTLQQKEYIYHLSEAAKAGRDITWDQNFKYNLRVRHLLEDILEKYDGERTGEEWDNFLVYAKRVFFSNGIHHHYADSKIIPGCSREYFSALAEAVGTDPNECKLLMYLIYDPEIFPTKRYQGNDKDLVKASAVNFYEGVTQQEVENFYAALKDASDKTPPSWGLNSKLVKENGVLREKTWRMGGMYDSAIRHIV
ncbi:MAG: dihydrofolate reductase, partial [Bacteroidales bacterium]|nr:dihydrofolate reductase [Bacteroidales bacterium]